MSTLSRRFLLAGAAALAAGPALPRAVSAQGAGPFTLPPLPYPADRNAPHVDAQTMVLHHDRHHAAYVTNLNAALAQHTALAAKPLEALLADIGSVPESARTAVRNSGGGHANHSMFWTIMGGRGGEPAGELKAAVDRDLGGLAKLQEDFNAAGGRLFGSGWVFVTVTREGRLALTTRPNQDTPLMEGGRVLMGNDVWEHAYYLTYQNRRPDYLKAWWNVVDWDRIAERYAAAKAGTLTI